MVLYLCKVKQRSNEAALENKKIMYAIFEIKNGEPERQQVPVYQTESSALEALDISLYTGRILPGYKRVDTHTIQVVKDGAFVSQEQVRKIVYNHPAE